MNNRMMDIAEENKLIGPEQFGFQRGKSTKDAIFTLSTLINKAKSKRWQYSLAFLDISKVEE